MSNNPDVVLYTAVSLDGYTADRDGGIAWLEPFDDNTGEIYGDWSYAAFYQTVGSLIMGRTTFEQVMGFEGPWQYTGKPVAVLSRTVRETPSDAPPDVQFDVGADIPALCAALATERPGRVWLVGGGEAVAAFLEVGQDMEVALFLIPVLLGDGLPLFPRRSLEVRRLGEVTSQTFANGVTLLRYRVTSAVNHRSS